MTSSWEKTKLGNVIQLVYGKPLPTEKRKPDGLYPVYGANGEIGRTDEFYYDQLSIIVGRKGSAGELNPTEVRFWPLDVTYFVTFDNKKYDLTFLFYLLSSLNLTSMAKGVKPGINRNDVYAIDVSIPPLAEQQRIVAMLDQIFEGIDKVIGNTRKNLNNAQELFNSYHNEVFSSPGYDWTEKELREVWQIEKKQNKGELLPYVGLEDIEAHTSKFLGSLEPKAVKSNSFLFNDNHLLYGRLRPYLNKVLLPYFEGHCSTEIFPIKTKPCLEKKFLYYWLTRHLIVEKINATCTGARMPRANMELVSRFKLSFPENRRQREIISSLDELSLEVTKLKSVYENRLEKLDELRKSILTQVFYQAINEVL